MARSRRTISKDDRAVVGRLLRELRRGAGLRSVERATELPGCPASRQTIYQYERGALTPSLPQFLELVRFYVLEAPRGDGAKGDDDLRAHAVAAVARVLELPIYEVVAARQLIADLQPKGSRR
jgi:transcriptional regulator with XRE-family HTH domain